MDEVIHAEDGVLLGTPLGRRLLGASCTVIAAGLLLWNMPVPGARGAYRDATEPAYEFAQIDQDWALFAPDVADTSIFLHLEAVHSDGGTEVIEFPDGDPWIGTYRAYRWSAYEESLLDGDGLDVTALRWAISESEDPDTIERVDVVLLESDVSTGEHGPFEPTYERSILASLDTP